MRKITKNLFMLTLDFTDSVLCPQRIEFFEVKPLEKIRLYGLTFFIFRDDSGEYRLVEKSTGTLCFRSYIRKWVKKYGVKRLKKKGKKETLINIAKRKFEINKTTRENICLTLLKNT